jgi:uncharacterized membrane protein YfcA
LQYNGVPHHMKTALFLIFGIFTAAFLLFWVLVERGRKHEWPGPLDSAIGVVTQFLDTLGIGSFATMSAAFKFWGTVPDEHIPGTLNVGATLPGILEAFIYIAVVEVDVVTLSLMIGASVVGAWLGAGVVSRWPRRKIQIGMGIALLATAAFGLLAQLRLLPGGGDVLGLTGVRLAIGVAANAVFGALMTLGIGLFAPCMMVTYWLGMSPKAVFPIMMGSTGLLGPVASVRFIRTGRYNFKAALGVTVAGVPAVLVAAFLVRSIPLGALRWLVICVVIYTALMMLRSAARERKQAAVTAPAGSRC